MQYTGVMCPTDSFMAHLTLQYSAYRGGEGEGQNSDYIVLYKMFYIFPHASNTFCSSLCFSVWLSIVLFPFKLKYRSCVLFKFEHFYTAIKWVRLIQYYTHNATICGIFNLRKMVIVNPSRKLINIKQDSSVPCRNLLHVAKCTHREPYN